MWVVLLVGALVVALLVDARPGIAPVAAAAPSAVSALADYGAACDGRTDDRQALVRAIADASATGGVVEVSGNCRIVQTGPAIALNGPVTLRGDSDQATLSLDSDSAGASRSLFSISGDGVTLQNLTLQRIANVSGVMLELGPLSRLAIDNVLLDGRKDSHPGGDFHGIAIGGGPGERIEDVQIRQTTIRNTDYGLLQDNSTTSITDGFIVDRSLFTENEFDDLEFNAPNGTMTGIQVTNSDFIGNLARDDKAPAGFGVGLANVQHALIQGNIFTGYRYDPVHIEDRSADVTVDGNTFSDAFTAPLDYASHVFVINGSRDITISNNVFDTSANANAVSCVYLGQGGGEAPVTGVTITGNTFHLGRTATEVGNYGATDVRIEDNVTKDATG